MLFHKHFKSIYVKKWTLALAKLLGQSTLSTSFIALHCYLESADLEYILEIKIHRDKIVDWGGGLLELFHN